MWCETASEVKENVGGVMNFRVATLVTISLVSVSYSSFSQAPGIPNYRDVTKPIERQQNAPPSQGATPGNAALAPKLTGSWRGKWTNLAEGYLYDAVLSLKAESNGTATGEIEWTLRSSPLVREQAMLGKSATELVRGSFDATSERLHLQGYGKRDPHNIIALDEYRLRIIDGAKVIFGDTASHGTWAGRIQLERR